MHEEPGGLWRRCRLIDWFESNRSLQVHYEQQAGQTVSWTNAVQSLIHPKFSPLIVKFVRLHVWSSEHRLHLWKTPAIFRHKGFFVAIILGAWCPQHLSVRKKFLFCGAESNIHTFCRFHWPSLFESDELSFIGSGIKVWIMLRAKGMKRFDKRCYERQLNTVVLLYQPHLIMSQLPVKTLLKVLSSSSAASTLWKSPVFFGWGMAWVSFKISTSVDPAVESSSGKLKHST